MSTELRLGTRGSQLALWQANTVAARILADRLQTRGALVSIVERKPERARALAQRLENCVVLEGEITDADLLVEEDVARMDVVIALTGEVDYRSDALKGTAISSIRPVGGESTTTAS